MVHILLTNDDGVSAPGLIALAKELNVLGKVSILAPDRNWSASGHVKTIHRPLRVKEIQLSDGVSALTTDGAPSDCVALAMLGIIPEKIDLVFSGINPNANLGYDVTYSGTVTAAMEATIWGLPGVAVSLDSPNNYPGDLDYSIAAKVACQVADQVIHCGLPVGTLLNVNVPYLATSEIAGFKITRQGERIYPHELDRRLDPRNHPYFWIGGPPPTGVPEDGTDFGALEQGFVSITPLHLNMTAIDSVDTLETWEWNLNYP
jgi:5'-nucleotidase